MQRVALSGMIIALLVFVVVVQTSSQESATKVYRDQFVSLHDRVQDMLGRSKAMPSRGERAPLNDELFATLKLVHRLEEEAAKTYYDGLQQGRAPDKPLLLVAQGCDGLNFVINALQNFLETQDHAFLGFAVDGMATVKSIRKLL